jgi:hypothetical protein
MSDGVHRIVTQFRAPRGKDPGKVAEGWYCTADNFVTLCDERGKPIGDKHILAAGEDPRPAACRLLRRRQSAGGSHAGFSGRLAYPKLRF